jgi:hypothetical protein
VLNIVCYFTAKKESSKTFARRTEGGAGGKRTDVTDIIRSTIPREQIQGWWNREFHIDMLGQF